jgi:hypothetical protein
MKRSKTYHSTTLALVEGEAHGIRVALRDYPLMEADDGSGKRVELFAGFNLALIEAIWQEMSGQTDSVIDGRNLSFAFSLRIREHPPIPFEIQVNERKSLRRFRGELPDALIDAFKRSGVRPRHWFT